VKSRGFLIAYAVGVAVFIAALVLLTADPASAHTASATPSCRGLEVRWTDYHNPYDLSVTIDGVTETFEVSGTDDRFFSWDPLTDHDWSVWSEYHDAVIDSGTQERCPPPTVPPKLRPSITPFVLCV
jgi:hypothetical protein